MYNGIINVYKEAGYTSFGLIARLRRILGQKKMGHTGTLDPQARGVLPVCLGISTKAVDVLIEHDKTYRAVLLLGIKTDTEDMSGQILKTQKVDVSKEDLVKVIESFIGGYNQYPPMYSAIKINGQKLCDIARTGREVERKPRRVDIQSIIIEKIEMPRVYLKIECGRGTYIRSLCRDIGDALGCGGCMEDLERTRVGIYTKENSYSLQEIEMLHRNGCLEDKLGKADELFSDYPRVFLKPEYDAYLYNGNYIYTKDADDSKSDLYNNKDLVRMYFSDEVFGGLYQADIKDEKFYPNKMFLETLKPVRRCIGIGKFDGCHLGHQLIFKQLQDIKIRLGLEPLLIVIDKQKKHILNDAERYRIVSSYGIDTVKKLTMDEYFMNTEPLEFISEVLMKKYHVQELVVGKDFHFGRDRKGDVKLLQNTGDKLGYAVTVVDDVCYKGEKISSSRISGLLEKGDFSEAERMLGFKFSISGYVAHGKAQGRKINYPTINISYENRVDIPLGVYIVKVYLEDEVYFGIGNLGRRPTVNDDEAVRFEIYIHGYEGDAYEKYVKSEILEYIRPEIKFSDMQELKLQIDEDIKQLKKYIE